MTTAILFLFAHVTANACAPAHFEELHIEEPPPSEIQVADAYDSLYGTDYGQDGLLALAEDLGTPMNNWWTTRQIGQLRVVAHDSASTAALGMRVGEQIIPLFDPGPWYGGTRGWMPGGDQWIDLGKELAEHGYEPRHTEFQLVVGSSAMTAENTWRIAGEDRTFLLAYNDNGSKLAGDGDGNEPIIQVRSHRRDVVSVPRRPRVSPESVIPEVAEWL